jgi:hypothetical protein
LRPARRRRFFTVSRGRFKAFAISLTVMPSMFPIIGILGNFIRNVDVKRQLLNVCKVNSREIFNKMSFFKEFYVDKSLFIKTI